MNHILSSAAVTAGAMALPAAATSAAEGDAPPAPHHTLDELRALFVELTPDEKLNYAAELRGKGGVFAELADAIEELALNEKRSARVADVVHVKALVRAHRTAWDNFGVACDATDAAMAAGVPRAKAEALTRRASRDEALAFRCLLQHVPRTPQGWALKAKYLMRAPTWYDGLSVDLPGDQVRLLLHSLAKMAA